MGASAAGAPAERERTGVSERLKAAARALAGIAGTGAMVLAMTVLPPGPTARADAPGGGGETISCEAGQTADSDLGTCVDPICGVGTERDPTGQTRYCVAIPCGPGQQLLANSNTCISWPPPPPKCPDGSIGIVQRGPSGITLIVCPRHIVNGPPHVIQHQPPATEAPRAH
jgi:hypothetical protein